jgi:hypothetical protein
LLPALTTPLFVWTGQQAKQLVQGLGVVINDSNQITNIAKLTSVEFRSNTYNDGIGNSGLFLTVGDNGVVQMTKSTYQGTQDALLSLHTDGTIQKSNIVSSAVATIDDSSTSASTTWSSSKVSAEISAGGGGENTLVADLSAETVTPNDYLTSGLNGSSIGVANQLFYGKYYTFKSATTMMTELQKPHSCSASSPASPCPQMFSFLLLY